MNKKNIQFKNISPFELGSNPSFPFHFASTFESQKPFRIAIVGSGPRGIATLERLAVRLRESGLTTPVQLILIDAIEVGCGRIWKTDQSRCFLMNTPAQEMSMFSGPKDDQGERPGAGPSLGEWWKKEEPEVADATGYAPRAVYGRYLQFVLSTIQTHLPFHSSLQRIQARVDQITSSDENEYLLKLDNGEKLRVHRVVLTTGHPKVTLDEEQIRLMAFASVHPSLHYFPGDSVAEMPLDQIKAGSVVGVLGMGLCFYDVMAELTLGRGGIFVEDNRCASKLRYVPSGREPMIVAGSRGGIPVLARGVNQKPINFKYQPVFFTQKRISEARNRGKLNFNQDVLPWLTVEMELVYLATKIKTNRGAEEAKEFTEFAKKITAENITHELIQLASNYGIQDTALPAFWALARPFANRKFESIAEFQSELMRVIQEDLEHAELGNLKGPLKAALDVIRDVRDTLRNVVDYAGLYATSHRDEFISKFVPVASLLSAGPPRLRLRQLLALMDQGMLKVVGPDARFDTDHEAGKFISYSPQVSDSKVSLDAFIDARIPTPALNRDSSPLTKHLIKSGMLTKFINKDTHLTFNTEGVNVTEAPYHPIRSDGSVEKGINILGIPVENTRWFNQVGSGRPDRWGLFTLDADRIAEDLMVAIETASQTSLVSAENWSAS